MRICALFFYVCRTILSMRRYDGQFCPEMWGGQFCPYRSGMDSFVRKLDNFVRKCSMDNFVHRLIVWTVLSGFVNYRWTIISILFIILDNNVLVLDNFVHLCVSWTILSDREIMDSFVQKCGMDSFVHLKVVWTILSDVCRMDSFVRKI